MAKHAKSKRERRKKERSGIEGQASMPIDEAVKTWAVEKERCSNGNDPSSPPQLSHHTMAAGKENAIACQTQTDDVDCEKCAELSDEVCHLISQLSDVEFIQQDLRKKLSTTKSNLATSIDRESKLRDANESIQLDEAQTRYELNQIKMDLIQRLDEQQKSHDDHIKAMNETLKEREYEWANKNSLLQKELNSTVQSTLMENQKEDWSLSSLEKEIASLQTVIELRGGENRQLREENNKLKNKLEDHHWLETELGKAKHRLEELTVIVQNKMVSERELLELSEALQRDLVRCRHETMLLKQQLENQLERKILTVKHSQSDLFNNNQQGSHIGSAGLELMTNARNRKLSSLEQIRDWAPEKLNNSVQSFPNGTPAGGNMQQDHRNQHQKASCGSIDEEQSKKPSLTPDLVLDLQEKAESVAWMLQMEPTKSTCGSPRNQPKSQKRI